ncbi:MotA/TolQ/ExbB proton channel family protein [Thiohalorhabdus sp. Cl-TMA]|uniref:MotA/TolQ/ExbB proton channel family protein n=1 Tax=Thiohalorhabdus methylotrophus TaxID=3242694 RepID=A0ABV4TRQ4_9GAMM
MGYGALADLVQLLLEQVGVTEQGAERIAGDFAGYFAAGGFVMPPLVLAAVLLWFAIGYRVAALRMGTTRDVQDLLERYAGHPPARTRGIVDDAAVRGLALAREGHAHLRRWLDDEFMAYEAELKKFSRLTVTLVEVAPIMGLLGTVVGMIETFDSLRDMALFTQSGGIAGGISQALFTTQMGLVVAIPGLIMHGLLRKKQQAIRMELARIKDLLCTEPAGFFLPRAETAPDQTAPQRQADG